MAIYLNIIPSLCFFINFVIFFFSKKIFSTAALFLLSSYNCIIQSTIGLVINLVILQYTWNIVIISVFPPSRQHANWLTLLVDQQSLISLWFLVPPRPSPFCSRADRYGKSWLCWFSHTFLTLTQKKKALLNLYLYTRNYYYFLFHFPWWKNVDWKEMWE